MLWRCPNIPTGCRSSGKQISLSNIYPLQRQLLLNTSDVLLSTTDQMFSCRLLGYDHTCAAWSFLNAVAVPFGFATATSSLIYEPTTFPGISSSIVTIVAWQSGWKRMLICHESTLGTVSTVHTAHHFLWLAQSHLFFFHLQPWASLNGNNKHRGLRFPSNPSYFHTGALTSQ